MAFRHSTTGRMRVRQGEFDVRSVQDCAKAFLATHREQRAIERELKRLSQQNTTIQAQAAAVGVGTACALWVAMGDPRDYHCGDAYRKAMGLNLKECSSGKSVGQLKITKRGPSSARRWMHMAALRLIQKPEIKVWYEAKKKRG